MLDFSDPRRHDPRVETRTLCSELFADHMRHGFVVEVSENGVRVERPWFGGPLAERVQLELEVPEVDEIIWAAAEPCYDVISRQPSGLVRTSGFRLVGAAGRSIRMLRDLVFETRRRQWQQSQMYGLLHASCYRA